MFNGKAIHMTRDSFVRQCVQAFWEDFDNVSMQKDALNISYSQ